MVGSGGLEELFPFFWIMSWLAFLLRLLLAWAFLTIFLDFGGGESAICSVTSDYEGCKTFFFIDCYSFPSTDVYPLALALARPSYGIITISLVEGRTKLVLTSSYFLLTDDSSLLLLLLLFSLYLDLGSLSVRSFKLFGSLIVDNN